MHLTGIEVRGRQFEGQYLINYINNQHMRFNVFVVFYSQYFHQHASAAIIAIFRVMLLLQEYEGTDVVSCNSGCNIVAKTL